MDLIGEEKLEGFVLRTLSVVEGKVCTPSAHSRVHFPPPAQSLGMRLQSYSVPPQAFIDVFCHRLNHNYVNNPHLLVKASKTLFFWRNTAHKSFDLDSAM